MENSTTIPLLLLSHFSRVRLCVTPETSAHEAPPSLGFLKKLKIELQVNQVFPHLGMHPEKRHRHPSVHHSTI